MLAAALLAFIPRAGALITASSYPAHAPIGVLLQDMSSGTTQLVGADQDDTFSSVTTIGFDFWYDGVRLTQFSVNPNGICRLGSSGIDSVFDNSTAFNATSDSPKICPYFDDLWVGTNGKVHYKVVGSAPNRKLVIEWLNMQIPRTGAGNTGAGTFQLWLFETTGQIEFVYGSGMAVNAANGGYSVGLQSGAATNLASLTVAGPGISYTSANNTQTGAIAPGTAFYFLPNVPAAPANLTFSAVTQTSMTLNWADLASNEVGYVIYKSDDNINFTFVTQTAANASSQNVSSLTPSTTYYWRVSAVSGGALSSALTGSQATNAANTITVAANGNWSAPATWTGGVVPTAADNVLIAVHTVNIDVDAAALNITVGNGGSGGALKFDPSTAHTLTVGQSVTVAIDGTFSTELNLPSTVTTHVLSIGRDLIVNGQLDFCTNNGFAGTNAGAKIVFTGATNNTFSAAGVFNTDIREIEINKGNSPSSILELNAPNNFTVKGVTSDPSGFVTLTNGTLKISGNFSMTSPVFKTASYTIPSTAGIWLNDPSFVVTGTATGTTTTNDGLFRVSNGIYNIGVGAGDEMGGNNSGVFIIEGGTVNAAGRIDPQGPVSYTQTGGLVNIATVGNTRSNFGSFELNSTNASFTMSGGTINLINRNSGATQIDYNVRSNINNITGGSAPLVVVGGAGSPGGTNYVVTGNTPNIQVNANRTMTVASALFMRGVSVVNSGTIVSASSSAFDFLGNSPMTYSNTGGGVLGTLAAPFNGGPGGGIGVGTATTVTLNGPIVANRVNLFQGTFVNSNQVTVTSAVAGAATVSVGGLGTGFPGGSFDVSPTFDAGLTLDLVYLQQAGPHTAGLEIPAGRSFHSLTVNSTNDVSISGGNITLGNGLDTPLTLTNGRLITGSNKVILPFGNSSVARTNGYVDGNLQKRFSGAVSKTFELGSADGYSPVTISATAGSFPDDVTVRATGNQHPNYPPLYPSFVSGLQRYWTISQSSSMTANVTFTYLDADIVGVENDYVLAKYSGGVFSSPASYFFAPGTNTAGVNSETAIAADWTLFDDADFDGMTTSYENAHGLNPNNAADANQDADGDGQSNLSEYFAGTDPQDATSSLRMTLATIDYPSGNFHGEFTTVVGKVYRVEYKDNLVPVPDWTTLLDVGASDSSSEFFDFSPLASKRFYRVRLLTP